MIYEIWINQIDKYKTTFEPTIHDEDLEILEPIRPTTPVQDDFDDSGIFTNDNSPSPEAKSERNEVFTIGSPPASPLAFKHRLPTATVTHSRSTQVVERNDHAVPRKSPPRQPFLRLFWK